MSILSDTDIKKHLMRKVLSIEPFKEDQLTPNGYDLSVAEVMIVATEKQISEGDAEVPPQSHFAVSTAEYVKFGPLLAGQLWIRSSLARRGVMASFGKVDAGFEGTLTLAAYNSSSRPITIPMGSTFAQLIFEQLSSPPEALYSDRSGKYQGQRGVTLDRY